MMSHGSKYIVVRFTFQGLIDLKSGVFARENWQTMTLLPPLLSESLYRPSTSEPKQSIRKYTDKKSVENLSQRDIVKTGNGVFLKSIFDKSFQISSNKIYQKIYFPA